ncbi:MAG TPA: tail fiber domain-containing protein, partial [Saprospiraceae bacterium]|nr:tail fiber domain-containing protein [Saprospiraceae bacterium]
MQKIQRLEGVNYQFRTGEFKERGFAAGNQIGLIAQNVEQVYPELVKTYDDGYKAVNYDGLVPVLLEGLKAQQQSMESLQLEKDELTDAVAALAETNANLKSRLDNLEAMLTQLTAVQQAQQERIHYQAIQLGNRQQIILNQNDPNPFSERTTITYFIPDDTKGAELLIHDTKGRILKRTALATGDGIVEVFASNLSSGIYTYSIVVDG